jgi:hypothetical protein
VDDVQSTLTTDYIADLWLCEKTFIAAACANGRFGEAALQHGNKGDRQVWADRVGQAIN